MDDCTREDTPGGFVVMWGASGALAVVTSLIGIAKHQQATATPIRGILIENTITN